MIDWDKWVIGPTVGVFGEPVTYIPLTAAAFDITGVFDEAYLRLTIVDGAEVATEQPTLGVQISQFTAAGVQPQQDDQLILQRTGVQYVVREVRPDGHGAARLMLNAVAEPNG